MNNSTKNFNTTLILPYLMKYDRPVYIFTAGNINIIREEIVASLGHMPQKFQIVSKDCYNDLINYVVDDVNQIICNR
jgi:hypothetical protein